MARNKKNNRSTSTRRRLKWLVALLVVAALVIAGVRLVPLLGKSLRWAGAQELRCMASGFP